MLENLAIQEIRDLKFYDRNGYDGVIINNLSNIFLSSYQDKLTMATFATLQAEYTGLYFPPNYYANESCEVEGIVIIKNLLDNELYEGKLISHNAKIEVFNKSNIIIHFYRFGNESPYIVEI